MRRQLGSLKSAAVTQRFAVELEGKGEVELALEVFRCKRVGDAASAFDEGVRIIASTACEEYCDPPPLASSDEDTCFSSKAFFRRLCTGGAAHCG